MGKIISVPLPQDLPENWNESQYVSPGGTEVGLTEQHGYNYLMRQVNNAQKAAEELDAGLGHLAEKVITQGVDFNTLTFAGVYVCSSGAVVQNCTNYPSDMPIGEFRLEVQQLIANTYIIHRLTAKNGNTVRDYIRTMSSGIWSSWSMDAAPYGFVEGQITYVNSAEDLDARLDAIYASMKDGKVRFVYVNFKVSHPILSGADRIFRIERMTDKYGIVHSVGYTTDEGGAVLEFVRSRFNGVWTSWARTYNTLYKPTLADLGAAPLGFGLGETSANTSNTDADSIIRTGFYGCNVNTPDGAWWYGLHIQYSPKYAYQNFAKTNDVMTAERWCFDGVWTPWKTALTGTTVVPASVE